MDEDFMNELQELTKSMVKEFSQEKSANFQSVKENTNDLFNKVDTQDPFKNLNLNISGNEEDCVKELEKLLSMGMDMNVDENDPQAKDLMKVLTDNLKDLEVKMSEMQKNLICNESKNVTVKKTEDIEANSFGVENINIDSQQSKKASNPFVDTFKDMNENSVEGGMMDFMKLFEQGVGGDANMGDIKNIYDILGKLSDNKDSESSTDTKEVEDKSKNLEGLFGDLLEFLLKSDMLAEPLTQIKNSVLSYLEKNKDKLKSEDEEKYKSMLNYIDTIMEEIHKKEPNKALVIDVFYRLHELSDIDGEILAEGDSAFKQFSDLFGNKKPK